MKAYAPGSKGNRMWDNWKSQAGNGSIDCTEIKKKRGCADFYRAIKRMSELYKMKCWHQPCPREVKVTAATKQKWVKNFFFSAQRSNTWNILCWHFASKVLLIHKIFEGLKFDYRRLSSHQVYKEIHRSKVLHTKKSS